MWTLFHIVLGPVLLSWTLLGAVGLVLFVVVEGQPRTWLPDAARHARPAARRLRSALGLAYDEAHVVVHADDDECRDLLVNALSVVQAALAKRRVRVKIHHQHQHQHQPHCDDGDDEAGEVQRAPVVNLVAVRLQCRWLDHLDSIKRQISDLRRSGDNTVALLMKPHNGRFSAPEDDAIRSLEHDAAARQETTSRGRAAAQTITARGVTFAEGRFIWPQSGPMVSLLCELVGKNRSR